MTPVDDGVPSTVPSADRRAESPWVGLWVPVVFVAFWSSGYLVGTLGTRAAPPFTLLFWRFVVALVVLVLIALVSRAPWPRGRRVWGTLLVTGVLLQTGQFAGVYAALSLGTSAGLASLIVSASPLVVSALAVPLFGEHLVRRQWAGLAVGLAGVALAVASEINGSGGVAGVLLTVLGGGAFVAGTLYQKRFGQEMDLRTGGSVQLVGATVSAAVLATVSSGFALPWTTAAVGSVVFLALVNSIAAFSFYFWLLRTRGAGSATSYLFLVPPATALLAVPLLGQPLHAVALAGIAVAAAGVAMVTWPTRPADPAGLRGSRRSPGPRRGTGRRATRAPGATNRSPSGPTPRTRGPR